MGQSLTTAKAHSSGPSGDNMDPDTISSSYSDINKLPETGSESKSLPTMESLHNITHEIFPVPFEGVKLVLNQGINQHFQLNHSWAFGTEKQSGYKFGATYVGHNKLSETEIYPIMLGELSPNGNLNAQIIHHFTPHIKCKYISQLKIGKLDGQQFAIEHRSGNLNMGFSLINPSFQNKEVSCLFDVMRRLTDRVSIGSMLVYQRSPQGQYPNFGVWNIGGQYSSGKWTAALGVRPLQSSMHSTFHMKINKNLQLGTEVEASLGHRQCVGTVGYQYDLSESGITIRSQIDSNWKIATSYERKFIAPIPFSFNICINGDIWKSVYGLGVGFSLL